MKPTLPEFRAAPGARPLIIPIMGASWIAWVTCGLWLKAGPAWHFTVNAIGSIVLLLATGLLKRRQDRTIRDIQGKLDALVRAARAERAAAPDFDDLSESEVRRLHEEYRSLAAEASRALAARKGRPPASAG